MRFDRLPSELCDLVLWHVDEVEQCAAACRALSDAVREHLRSHSVRVRVGECVCTALTTARPGATVHLDAGTHVVLAVLVVRSRVRLRGPPSNDDDSLDGRAILVSPAHTLLRVCTTTRVDHLALCCLGRTLGHPSAAVEGVDGTLLLVNCVVTSRAQIGFMRPVCGVWAGQNAHVRLERCTLLGCAGPALRVDRGILEARDCSLANSQRGGNVVARGGELRLLQCRIYGAHGDAISLWSDARAVLESNLVFDNGGSGVACHSSYARIARNTFFCNRHGPLFLAARPYLEDNRMLCDDPRECAE